MNIVFDIGNVICEWDPQKLVASVFLHERDRKEALEQIIFHNDWLQLDKGTISVIEATTRAVERSHLDEEQVKALYKQTPKSLVPFPETVSTIIDLKEKGHKLYVLSNMHAYAFEYLRAKFDFWDYFSGFVISSHIQTIKPEMAIFEYLIETYKLSLKDTVFLDDMTVNIDVAEKIGIKTILVNTPSKLREKLYKKFGI